MLLTLIFTQNIAFFMKILYEFPNFRIILWVSLYIVHKRKLLYMYNNYRTSGNAGPTRCPPPPSETVRQCCHMYDNYRTCTIILPFGTMYDSVCYYRTFCTIIFWFQQIIYNYHFINKNEMQQGFIKRLDTQIHHFNCHIVSL